MSNYTAFYVSTFPMRSGWMTYKKNTLINKYLTCTFYVVCVRRYNNPYEVSVIHPTDTVTPIIIRIKVINRKILHTMRVYLLKTFRAMSFLVWYLSCRTTTSKYTTFKNVKA